MLLPFFPFFQVFGPHDNNFHNFNRILHQEIKEFEDREKRYSNQDYGDLMKETERRSGLKLGKPILFPLPPKKQLPYPLLLTLGCRRCIRFSKSSSTFSTPRACLCRCGQTVIGTRATDNWWMWGSSHGRITGAPHQGDGRTKQEQYLNVCNFFFILCYLLFPKCKSKYC